MVFAAILFFGKYQYIKANRILGIMLFFFAFGAANMVSQMLHIVPGYFRFGYLFALTGAAAVYFYIRVYFHNAYEFKPKDLWYLMPLIIQLVLWVVFMMSLSETEREVFTFETPRTEHFYIWQADVFFMAVILFYLYLSIREIKKYKTRAVEEYSYSNAPILRWLYIFLFCIMGIPLIMNVVLDVVLINNPLLIIAITGILWAGTVILIFLFRPEIYEGIGVLAPIRLKPLRDTSLSFSEEEKTRLFEKLISFIKSNMIYLDSGLTLKQLSDALGTNQNYLSRAINGISGKSFLDFINTYQIKYAVELLRSKSFSKFTIEGIAKESGFRSKSAFYNYFKKYNGMSPMIFIEQRKVSTNP